MLIGYTGTPDPEVFINPERFYTVRMRDGMTVAIRDDHGNILEAETGAKGWHIAKAVTYRGAQIAIIDGGKIIDFGHGPTDCYAQVVLPDDSWINCECIRAGMGIIDTKAATQAHRWPGHNPPQW